MKKLFTILCLFIFTVPNLTGQCGNLYIGGVFDGPLTGGTPKGFQICASGDISDLSIYGLGVANNGGGSDGQEYTFPALAVSSGDCFWVAYEGSSTGDFNAFFGFEPCFFDAIANVNGDDPVELFCSGSLEDEYGDVALDGTGLCWEYKDGWAVNNSGGPNFGTFMCSDWTFSGPDALDGETSNATATSPYPTPNQTCPAVLPVSFKTFDVRAIKKTNIISWTTATEINNEKFVVERSADGKRFETIGEVKGNGNSLSEIDYSFTDSNPNNGINYYRLKQMDFDGGYEFTSILVAKNNSSRINIYPTSTTDYITIDQDEKTPSEVIIMNEIGQVVIQKSITASTQKIDLSLVNSGLYYVQVRSNSETVTRRVIKQ